MHAPKREVFDVPAMTNTDNKGFVRPVDEYRELPYGLYMSRTADHPRFDRLESWLLPGLGLRANIFHFTPGHRPGQRLYLDVGRFSGPDEAGRWHAVDWYLDLVDVPGRPLELIDVDELFQAHAHGLVSIAEATEAVEIGARTLTGAAGAGNVQDWLDAQVGDRMTWLDRP
jgi:predicted RNA-binding protein associated with RNAse of E/G family